MVEKSTIVIKEYLIIENKFKQMVFINSDLLVTEETVLGAWFHFMNRTLDQAHFSEELFASLPMRNFIPFDGLRQVQFVLTLREMIQNLFHANG